MKRKVIIILSTGFILFMAVLLVYYLMKGDSSRWQVALGGMVVSGLPLLLLFLKNNPFNIPTVIGYYIFLFCSTYLGSIANFYLAHKWWDTTIHLYKGMYVGFAGITLYKLFITPHVRKDISQWILFLFVLSLSVVASVLWEVYEFVGDQFFTHTMQRGGNTDTMIDLITGTAGGLLVAIYARLRKQRV